MDRLPLEVPDNNIQREDEGSQGASPLYSPHAANEMINSISVLEIVETEESVIDDV
jgi:hypothetical protein